MKTNYKEVIFAKPEVKLFKYYLVYANMKRHICKGRFKIRKEAISFIKKQKPFRDYSIVIVYMHFNHEKEDKRKIVLFE